MIVILKPQFYMNPSLKIKIAAFIGLTFFFRLFFANIGAFAAAEASSKTFARQHESSVVKKKRRLDGESTVKSYFASEQNIQEYTEERQENEEDFSQVKKISLLLAFFPFLKGAFDCPKPGRLFDSIKCHLFPKKYLAISVIRI